MPLHLNPTTRAFLSLLPADIRPPAHHPVIDLLAEIAFEARDVGRNAARIRDRLTDNLGDDDAVATGDIADLLQRHAAFLNWADANPALVPAYHRYAEGWPDELTERVWLEWQAQTNRCGSIPAAGTRSR